jgi:Bacteriophage probable baseplate hub protein
VTRSCHHAPSPVFKIDGSVKGELARDVASLEVEETTMGLKTLRATFGNLAPRDGARDEQLAYFDSKAIDFGKKIEVSLGPSEDARIVFSGYISAIEGRFEEATEPMLSVFAEDNLMKLRTTRRSRTYRDQSDAQIAQAIAAEHGLTADADADGPTYDVVQQWNQSDLAFLRDRAQRIRAELWVEDDKLFFKARNGRIGPALTLVQGNELFHLRVRADLAHQRTQINVSGYDADARDVIDEAAAGDVIQSEISGGRTGPDVLQRAFGERVSFRVREAPLTSAEARAWARAEMLRRARGFVQVSGVARGSPDMIVGSILTLERIGGPFSGDGYYVTRVCHTYDPDGYRTSFDAEQPTIKDNA